MLGYFLRHCKRHANIPHNIPNEIRNNINKCDHEAGLYSQVVMIQRQTNVDKYKNSIKNKTKYSFQGKSARSQDWFKLDLSVL